MKRDRLAKKVEGVTEEEKERGSGKEFGVRGGTRVLGSLPSLPSHAWPRWVASMQVGS